MSQYTRGSIALLEVTDSLTRY